MPKARMAAAGLFWLIVPAAWCRPPLPEGAIANPDLVYKQVQGRNLMLDLFEPAQGQGPFPLIIYIHGGGWERGSRHQCPAFGMLNDGFAVASIDYRLSQEAHFPAQIEDCKAAVRWLRANAAKYRLDPDRFGAWGTSAGAHLAALLGTSGGVSELEGGGENLKYSSRVQAVCAVAAPTDFEGFGQQFSANPKANQALSSLLGDAPNRKALSTMASPIHFISADDPPFLLVHGAHDRLVPVEQSRRFYAALQKAGVKASLEILPDLGHEGAMRGAVPAAEAFFRKTLMTNLGSHS